MDLSQVIHEAVMRALKEEESCKDSSCSQKEPCCSEEELWVPVGVSARHIHLSQQDVERLFGAGHTLHPMKELQPGQFSCEETVTLVGPKGSLRKVRVLGPARSQTQVEVSATDGFTLGVVPPVRLSGDVDGTPGIAVVGPEGAFALPQGVIVAKRHIHVPTADAERWHLRHGQVVQVAVENGCRRMIFDDVVLRVGPNFRLEMHIDTDEANAAGLRTGDKCRVLLPREER